MYRAIGLLSTPAYLYDLGRQSSPKGGGGAGGVVLEVGEGFVGETIVGEAGEAALGGGVGGLGHAGLS
jgi:hypothetical protein